MKLAVTYALILRSRPSEIDETIRMRGLLKIALRRFGFRCLSVGPQSEIKNSKNRNRI